MKTDTLDAAYRATTYRLFLPEGVFDLRLDQVNADFANWLAAEGIEQWALLTAHNPGGEVLSAALNAERQSQLEVLLLEDGYEPYTGENVADAGDWPVEESCFVSALSVSEAMILAEKFGQNAVVAGRADGVPHLLWGGDKHE